MSYGLREWLNLTGKPMDIAKLDLFHTADGEDLLTILEDGVLRPSLCAVYHRQEILYFFLGRPAYKIKISYEPGYWQLPIVFIARNLLIKQAIRALPFDSGALNDHRYREIIGKIPLSKFEIKGDKDEISMLISKFFGSIESYKSANARGYHEIRSEVGANTANFVPIALAKLYTTKLTEIIDDRTRLVEIQLDTKVPLDKHNIKGVIICSEWLRDRYIREKLDALEVKIHKYPVLPLNTQCYYSEIYKASGISDV